MTTLYLLLLFPLIWPFIGKAIWKHDISLPEMGINIVVVALLTWGMFAIGQYSMTSDTEILNGQITLKNRDHGSYTRTYDCHCRTDSKGNRKCQTCREKHYTVKWYLNSTVGTISIDSADSTSRSVYDRPNPRRYEIAFIGEPCSLEHGYTNYVQAVPESLFRTIKSASYDKYVPKYPRVFDFYRVNRVVNISSGLPANTIKDLQDGASGMLRTLGAQKQVNIIFVVTNIEDPALRYAFEGSWLGGKKNDVVIFLGVKGTKIVWADTMTFALNKGNELFQVKMRDGLQDIGTVDPVKILNFTQDTIRSDFKRVSMSEFKYLEDEISPPTWAIILMVLISILASVGLSIWFAREEVC
jgi:hypothetical protein